MSVETVRWALDEAPMLRTKSGKPDTTARSVLVARAERANPQGRDSHAAVEDVMWRTGYDERTIQRAEARLEEAGLIIRDGTTRFGTPRWNLDMSRRRDPAERAEVEAAIDRRRAENAARERSRRKLQRDRRVDPDSPRVEFGSPRGDSASTPVEFASTRVDATPPEPSLNHPGTTREAIREPPTGGAPPPDPRRPPAPPSSGLATDERNSRPEPLTPAQDQQGELRPRAY